MISAEPPDSAYVIRLDAHQLHELHLEHLAHEKEYAQPVVLASRLSGTLSCSGLESLWSAAGGRYGARFIAAEIAMAESGGRQYATGPVGERGYWQINPVNGSISTYDPIGNAKAAIILSYDGENWDAWTTYVTGAYIGRCL